MPLIFQDARNGVFVTLTLDEANFIMEERLKDSVCEHCGHLYAFHTSKTDCRVCGIGKCPVNHTLME